MSCDLLFIVYRLVWFQNVSLSFFYLIVCNGTSYWSILQGLGNSQDLYSVLKIVVEMKSAPISIDRTAYTAMVDALLACGSINGKILTFYIGEFAI